MAGTGTSSAASTPTGSPAPDDLILRFGEFRIDPSTRRLSRNSKRIRIQSKPLDVLIYLVEHHERMVTREELLKAFWPRRVNEEALTRCVSTIRKTLDDYRDPPRYIETLWGQGYRMKEPVRTEKRAAALAGSQSDETADERGIKEAASISAGSLGIRNLLSWLALAVVIIIGIWIVNREATNPPAPSIQRIAVLPIDAPDDEAWAADALTDHLISTIARIEGIQVVARGSVTRFSRATDPVEIGQRLDVDAVLTSQWRRRGDAPGLQSKLVSTSDGGILWNSRVDPGQAETDAQQLRLLAQAVARQLWANLQLRDVQEPVNPEAYRHYLRGRYYWNRRSATSLRAAINSFNSALDLQPDYLDALVGLADSWLLLPLYGAVAPNEAIPNARAAAQQALRLDGAASHAHAVIGVINLQYDHDWVQAESHLRRAVTLNPNDVSATQWLGELYCYQVRKEDCWRFLNTAAGLDPLSPVLHMLQGSPHLWWGAFDDAVAAYEKALEQSPDFIFTNFALGLAHTGQRNWNRAIDRYEECLPEAGLAIIGGPLIFALARSGDTGRARQLLAELELLQEKQYVPPSKLATAYLGLGDREKALERLWLALDQHDDRLVYLALDVHFLELHEDPEFRRIAEQAGVLEVLDRR